VVPVRQAARAQGRERNERPRLSRAIVLQTALQLVDDEGPAALSMRRLAERLPVHRWVGGKDSLVDGVAELALAAADFPEPTGRWDARIRESAIRFRDAALAHPNVLPLITARTAPDQLTWRSWRIVLDGLAEGGLRDRDAHRWFTLFSAFFNGFLAVDMQAIHSEVEWQQLVAERVPGDKRLAALARHLDISDRNREFAWGLDQLLRLAREL
jgi:TetR/AcrR family tetracycline transcriptional repressor